MPVHGGPNTVEDGLVLSLDAADRNSYVSGSTTWFDLSGNNNSGSLINGPVFNNDDGGSIVFDGVNDYLTLTTPLTLGVDTSISFWISSNETAINTRYLRLLGTTGNTTGGYFEFEYYNRILSKNNTGNNFFFCTNLNTAPTLNQKINNIVFVFEADTSVSIYINGIKSTFLDGNLLDSTLQFNEIMRSRGSTNPGGDLSIVKMYNRALTEEEVTQNYNAQKARFGL